jgi:hypothetical protein
MGVPREVFDEDYLYFYWEVLSDQRADSDAEVITRLLGLRPGMRVLDMPLWRRTHRGTVERTGVRSSGHRQQRALTPAGACAIPLR